MKHKNRILSILGSGVDTADRLIEDYDELVEITDILKEEGRKIVFTSGTYDLYHLGHARYLQKAHESGGIVVVGVDCDALAREKGANRPVVPYDERSELLTHNRSTSIVIPLFNSERSDALLKKMRPDVLVLSHTTNDRNKDFIKTIKEKLSPYCGEIKVFDRQATTSTSARVRLLTIDGAVEFFEEIKKVYEKYTGKGEESK